MARRITPASAIRVRSPHRTYRVSVTFLSSSMTPSVGELVPRSKEYSFSSQSAAPTENFQRGLPRQPIGIGKAKLPEKRKTLTGQNRAGY